MPRIKNTFLKGKMNQDLDDRLLPNGEYREAVNLNITKSDAADVGALQSIPSSLRIDTGESTLSVLGNPSNIKVIGFFVDKTKNNFFTFVTNFTDDGQGGRPTSSDTCAILTQGENDTQPKILAQGEFLNFSKNFILQEEKKDSYSNYWMNNILITTKTYSRALLIEHLKENNIDSRPVFSPISQYPIWKEKFTAQTVATYVGSNAINLPSGVSLSKEEVKYISKIINKFFE